LYLQANALRASLAEARKRNPKIRPRALVVINPGNPTGSILSYQDLKDIVLLCKEENLLLMADEVYQSNVWNSQRPFISFKKVLRDLGEQVWTLALFVIGHIYFFSRFV
jgi:aspartate/methionine/tyrosine aminotransferase